MTKDLWKPRIRPKSLIKNKIEKEDGNNEVMYLSFMRIRTLPASAASLAFISNKFLACSLKRCNLVSISELCKLKLTAASENSDTAASVLRSKRFLIDVHVTLSPASNKDSTLLASARVICFYAGGTYHDLIIWLSRVTYIAPRTLTDCDISEGNTLYFAIISDNIWQISFSRNFEASHSLCWMAASERAQYWR